MTNYILGLLTLPVLFGAFVLGRYLWYFQALPRYVWWNVYLFHREDFVCGEIWEQLRYWEGKDL